MTELIQYLKYSGPSTLIILAGLVWGKNLIKYFFDETIEIKKLELSQNLELHKAEIDKQTRNFQHSLDTRLNEFNIRYSELHQERAKVIKNLYFKLVELHSAMYVFTRRAHIVYGDSEQEAADRIERVNKAYKDFNNYFLPNKIFFGRAIVNKLNHLSQQYWDKAFDFSSSMRDLKDVEFPRNAIKENFAKIKEISEIVEKDFVKLLEDIEDEFRNILGVE